ncbi:MAG: SDR family oxidoreductase [Bdellovibrionales bacterium]
MNKKTLLICGGTGLLGPYISEAFEDQWTIVISARHSQDYPCDFTDKIAVKTLIDAVRPDAVLHLIAVTDIEACEQNPEYAHSVNAQSVSHVVEAIGPDTQILYISTDQVYPDTAGPHAEDVTDPVNVYGITKLAGEKEALAHPAALVLRVNLFGPSRNPKRKSLSDFFIDSFTKAKSITLFDDVLFSPLHMKTLARIARKSIDRNLRGVYNLGSRKGLSKAEFALKLAAHLGLDTSHAAIGQSTAIAGRARRTHDLRLDVSRIEKVLGLDMPMLEEDIKKL